ncbi:uncharacterized protein KIAA1671 isoform X2 [Oncorhynchus tshawytscha]|uniref:uncharacterized protein KIAA1671 isoform X2 n=1 Tax=Oncorhynchus tshawytscha TaxID=74940 RepID=UPI001C3C6D91|nr:uncharacterized protein KIAA1671 isoform X2 [Oncorhynchus tshawytscha]
MQNLSGKLSSAQVHVSSWVGSVRRSLQEALNLVWKNDDEEDEVVKEEQEKEKVEEEEGEGGDGRFHRAVSPMRSFASQSRRSLRLFSVRSRQRIKLSRRAADTSAVQLTCYVGAGEGRDTESLIGGEPDKQYGGCDTRLSEDDCRQTTEDQISPVITPVEPNSTSPLEETEDQISPVITPDEPNSTSPLEETEDQISPVITPYEPDNTYPLEETEDQISPVITTDEPDSTSPLEETEDPLPFPDISAPLLDTSVLRARAELRKSRRTRPTRAFRQSSTTIMLEEDPVHDWRFYDSSDKLDSLIRGDCASGEEQPRGREVCSQPSQPQRIALFSGMDPSALKAQLKKRGGGGGGGGGGAGGGEGVDTDCQTDRLSPSPSQLSRSPRRSSFLPGMSRVLPPVGNKGAGGDKSPSWLRELKSKKRSSQYNSEA